MIFFIAPKLAISLNPISGSNDESCLIVQIEGRFARVMTACIGNPWLGVGGLQQLLNVLIVDVY